MRLPFTLGLVFVATVRAPFAAAQEPVRLATTHETKAERSVLDMPANLVVDGVPRVTALTRLSESSGVALAFSSTLLAGYNQKVSCDCARSSVGDALARLLNGTPLRYRVLDGQIVITPQPAPQSWQERLPTERRLVSPVPGTLHYAVLPGVDVMRHDGAVAGTVVDSSAGRPLAGAQVAVTGTALRTATDEQGRFRLANVPGERVSLRVTLLGYKPLTLAVNVGDDNVRVALATAPVGLEAMVVTASGEQRLREVGSAIERVRADSAALTAPATNIAELLSSRAAGVYVKTGSGSSVGGTRIRIRGASSPSLANEPIVYVDGIRVSTDPQSLSYANNQQVPSRFDDLNPNEIESIDILKGPSASTMYGTEAANGVILIKTKSGAGATRRAEWQLWGESGRITEPNDYPANYGGVTSSGAPCLLTSVAAGTCTQSSVNTFNLLMNPTTTPFRTGGRSVLGARVTGRSGEMTYHLSGEYQDESGVYKPVDGVRKANVRANIGLKPADKLQVEVSTGYTASELKLFADGGTALGIVTNALAGGACATCWFQNSPQLLAQIDARQHVERFIGSATGRLQVAPWMQLRSTVGLDAVSRLDQRLFPVGMFPGARTTGERDVGRNTELRPSADILARFDFALPRSISSVTSLGAQYTADRYFLVTAVGTQLVPGSNSLSAAGLVATREQTTEVKTAGAYLEQQFGFRDRFFLTAGARSDNNSSFGQQFDAIIYPKVGASWVISEEGFFPRSTPLNSLRLRATWGQSGSQPGPLNAVTYYNSFPSTLPDGTNQVGVSFEGGNLGNPELKPERSSETEAGLDAAFMRDRISLSLTYYNKLTKDALVLRQVAPSAGSASGRWENLSEVRNRGVEASVNALLFQNSFIKADVSATATHNKNALLRLGEGVAPIPLGTNQRHVQGYPLGGYWMRTIKSFADANGDGIIAPSEITPTDTAVYLGETTPPTMGAIQPSIQLFDRFRVNALVAISRGNKLYNFTEGFRCNGGEARGRNERATPLADQARCVAHALLGVPGGFVEDASFTKLRELSFTYYLPRIALDPVRARTGSLTLAGQNLGTWTNYPGIDPDISSRGSNFETVDFLQPGSRRVWVLRANLGF